jgi:hypothetical protein
MVTDPTHLLYGPDRSPRTRVGKKLFDEVRGWVVVRKMSAGRIPLPMGGPARRPGFVLTGDLVRALRTESNIAITYWWGVNSCTVWKWRRRLDVPAITEGTIYLKSAFRLGKPLPPEVVEAMRRGRRGILHSSATRARMSASHKARGPRPPNENSWTAKEDELVRKYQPKEAAKRIGRTMKAIFDRRHVLGITARQRRRPGGCRELRSRGALRDEVRGVFGR